MGGNAHSYFQQGSEARHNEFVLNRDSLMPVDMFLLAISVSYSLFTFRQQEQPTE